MSQDKTEAPTPKRQMELRRKGQVIRSQDLGAAAVLLGAVMALRVFGGGVVTGMQETMRASFTGLTADELTLASVIGGSDNAMLVTLKMLLPLFAVLPIIAIAATVAQTGLVLTLQPLSPNFGRVNPLQNTKKMLISVQALVSLLKGLAKFGIVGGIAFFTLYSRREEIAALGQQGLQDGVAAFVTIGFDVALRSAFALLAVAAADYIFQRWQYQRDARMSKQEVRDEMRQMEGDPATKARIRRARASLIARMMQGVPQADVVITNPTTFAVALKYDPLTMGAPKVVAKGQRLMAQRIKDIAIENNIPIVENVPLARALYRSATVGKQIPAELYQAVAEVLAFVYRVRQARSGAGRLGEPRIAA